MSTSTEQRHTKTVAHAFAELMNGHDPDAVDGFVARGLRQPQRLRRGRSGGEQGVLGAWFAAFPDTEVSLDDVLVDGDRVAADSPPGDVQGPFMGLPPTGRPVVMHSIDIWRVVDGMAVEHWDQLDGQAFFAQLTGEVGSR